MRILDRYVIFSFLRNYLISFFVLVGMYVVLDMMFNIDEFAEVRAKSSAAGVEPGSVGAALAFVWYVSDFYVFQIPMYFVHLSGIIPLVAAAFTLMRMIRFNELSAILSAGVPLLRVAMPIVVVALVLQGLLWVDQELLIPNIIHKVVRDHDEVVDADSTSFPIEAMRDDERNAKLFAGRYYPYATPPSMKEVDIIEQDSNLRPVAHIRAQGATWDESSRSWKLEKGVRNPNIASDAGERRKPYRVESYQGGITPTEIRLYRSGSYVELLSTRNINELLKRPLSYGRADLLRVKHSRIAQILTNMILLLLAIAAVLTREPRQLKTGATRCVLLCGACLTVAFLGQELAGSPPAGFSRHWPALLAWLPIFTFGPLSIWLLDRVKT
jgi:lipopolysaccharide export LptBFGC system permease protein LptF